MQSGRYGTILLDGDLEDWDDADRLDTPSDGAFGYAVYGRYTDDAFVFALKTDGAQIGTNTTFWLNTDRNTFTGHQIWGFAGGAEYNINIGSDGTPALYSGGAGEFLVSPILDHRFNDNGTVLEFAVPTVLLANAPRSINVYIDVNDSVFLPGDYSSNTYSIRDPSFGVPSLGGPKKIAIIYSETTAKNFYDLTAYSQLFMAAQHQAMQAGLPFDVLSESDLKDASKLSVYSTLVFPGLSHVKAADLPDIEKALATVVHTHHVGLIAAGNFLTNDENGSALPGDSYARMKSLLGVTLENYGATNGIGVRVTDAGHRVTNGYTAGEIIGQYGNTSFLDFRDITGSGRSLFTQEIVTPSGARQIYDAVIATQTGGRNVHFASDAILGNSNILQQAIEWSALGSLPSVKLQMTRGSSLFAARNDMDQSQETWDVSGQSPGIYDVMNPIVAQWHKDFNFVGSYYINIGNNPPDQITNWSVSKPYYDQLLALGSEIGTHSYTHPYNTNLLSPDQIEFEFNQSKLIIEQFMGISVVGAAIPGNPERLSTAREIIQYFDYISGGYSGQGAGYPGAFGYLSAENQGKVYLAPNMSFDFTVIQWLGLTPEQASAYWANEYARITSHAAAPIILFPWHDYGPTMWDIDPGSGRPSPYSLEMYTTLLRRAYQDGTEFVTLADLARRIVSFERSELALDAVDGRIVATVNSTDAGRFALSVGATIASVENWYAYDGDSVFLPRNGGTFVITPGDAPADVTRIAALPMRAELLTATGDGTDLSFSMNGLGDVRIDLRTRGAESLVASGADGAELDGDLLTLSFATAATHSATVRSVAGASVQGTAGKDAIFGGPGDNEINGNGGADLLVGGAGNDRVIYQVASTIHGDSGPASAGAANDTLVLTQAGAIDLSRQTNQDVTGRSTVTGFENVDAAQATAPVALSGSVGANLLIGGSGADRLDGGAGNDQLIGGAGVDHLTGGPGNDVFIFRSIGDSGVGRGRRDIIADFVKGQDIIDLSLIDANTSARGDQAFAFVSSPTSSIVKNSITWNYERSDNVTIIRGDVSGNRRADFEIELAGMVLLSANDFIL